MGVDGIRTDLFGTGAWGLGLCISFSFTVFPLVWDGGSGSISESLWRTLGA